MRDRLILAVQISALITLAISSTAELLILLGVGRG